MTCILHSSGSTTYNYRRLRSICFICAVFSISLSVAAKKKKKKAEDAVKAETKCPVLQVGSKESIKVCDAIFELQIDKFKDMPECKLPPNATSGTDKQWWYCLSDAMYFPYENIPAAAKKGVVESSFKVKGLPGSGVKALGDHAKASAVDKRSFYFFEWIRARDDRAVIIFERLRKRLESAIPCRLILHAIEHHMQQTAIAMLRQSSDWRSCFGTVSAEKNASRFAGLHSCADVVKEIEAITGSAHPRLLASGNPAGRSPVEKPIRIENSKVFYNYDVGQAGGASGGWGQEPLLEGWDSDRCDIDHVDGSKLDLETFAREYASWGRPVKIKSPPSWIEKALFDFTEKKLSDPVFADHRTKVSTRPYVGVIGAVSPPKDLSIAEFVQQRHELKGKEKGVKLPYYYYNHLLQTKPGHAFKAKQSHFSQRIIETFTDWPFPPWLLNNTRLVTDENAEWGEYTKLQIFIGPGGSGSDMHMHEAAFSVVLYGKRRWFLAKPSSRMNVFQSAQDWLVNVRPKLPDPDLGLYECFAEQGDVMYVPRRWGHMVLNLNDVVSLALENHKFNWDSDLVVPHHKDEL